MRYTTSKTKGKRYYFPARAIIAFGLVSPFVRAQDCEPCANGRTPSTADDDYCAVLIDNTATLSKYSSECLLRQLENYQEDCCDEAPRGVCTLCPNGSSFNANMVVPNFHPEDGDKTCADLNGDEDFLDYIFESGTCSDTLLQRAKSWCGCPGVQRQCHLCPDGSKPPNPNLVDPVYYGWNCATFDFVSSYFSQDECTGLVDEIFEFDAPAYCGCPSSPIPDVCDFCPNGEELIKPDTRLGSGSFTCREIALSTKYIPVISTCIAVLTSYRSKGYMEECCGVPLWKRSTSSTVFTSNVLSGTILLTMISLKYVVWS